MSAGPVTTRETRHRARETKFVADISVYPELLQWARRQLAPDSHGVGLHADQYATATLYFETRGFDVYRRQGSYGRSKYRIRRYNISDSVFVERKFRTERLLAKRRTLVPLGSIASLADGAPHASWPGFWFHRRIRLRGLRPLVQLSYDRVARVAPSSNGPVRLTIDRSFNALPLADYAFVPGAGQCFLERACIVEMKYQVALPALFKEFIETFSLAAQKISKFRAALRTLDYPLSRDADEELPFATFQQDPDPAGIYAD